MITLRVEINDTGDRLKVEKTFHDFPADHPILKSKPGDEVECDIRTMKVSCVVVSMNMSMNNGDAEIYISLEAFGILCVQFFIDAHKKVQFDKVTYDRPETFFPH
jgi:hypothetical protein